MTPADVIEKALRQHLRLGLTRTTIEHAQRGWPIPLSGGEAEDAAQIALDALADAGLVVVPTEDLRARDDKMERLREERDQAIAHDRQPYPTQWAYALLGGQEVVVDPALPDPMGVRPGVSRAGGIPGVHAGEDVNGRRRWWEASR